MSIQTIFVLGSGAMGSGIAENAIHSGFRVILRDISESQLDKAYGAIAKRIDGRVAKGKITKEEGEAILARLSTTTELAQAAEVDMVIEAGPEILELKKSMFAEICQICSETTILATNTSSFSITSIATVVPNPSRFIGAHFFNPVPLMKLLEIVRGLDTSEETIEIVKGVGAQLGKETIVSTDSVGFIVNRLLDPMINEAFDLIERGVGTPADIDKGCRFGLNWPMGPCELIDMAGIDIELAVMETIYADTGDSKYRPSPLMRRMVEAGRLGRKTGRGFYDYTEKK